MIKIPCEWCTDPGHYSRPGFIAIATTEAAAHSALREHKRAHHHIRYALWSAGVLGADGRTLNPACIHDGRVTLPPIPGDRSTH